VLSISSNLDQVIAELNATANDLESGLVKAVCNPKIYLADLKSSARSILDGLTTDGEKASVPVMVENIIGFVTSGGMSFQMTIGSGEGSIAEIEPGDVDLSRMAGLESDIRDWVTAEKEKTEKDFYKGGRGRAPGEAHSVDKITGRVIATMQHKPQAWFGSKSSDGLLAHLKEQNPTGLDEALGLTALAPSRITVLVTAVLDFWEQRMGVRIVEVANAEIEKAFAKKLS
jgi:hypothetical protein